MKHKVTRKVIVSIIIASLILISLTVSSRKKEQQTITNIDQASSSKTAKSMNDQLSNDIALPTYKIVSDYRLEDCAQWSNVVVSGEYSSDS